LSNCSFAPGISSILSPKICNGGFLLGNTDSMPQLPNNTPIKHSPHHCIRIRPLICLLNAYAVHPEVPSGKNVLFVV
jgi:hypothetical protein